MTRKSSGQKVKTFTVYVPNAELTGKTKLVVSIMFRAGDCTFAAKLPDHIAEGIGRHPEVPKSYAPHEQAIVSTLAGNIEGSYEAALKLYEQIQRNVAKKKVIQVFVQANARGNRFQGIGAAAGFHFKEISFTTGPALNIWHRVLWQVGDGLYTATDMGDGRLTHLSYMAQAPKIEHKPGATRESFLLDWTPEREAFFDRTREGLLTLIERLGVMLGGDTGANVDRLIASGGLALPAPERKSLPATVELDDDL